MVKKGTLRWEARAVVSSHRGGTLCGALGVTWAEELEETSPVGLVGGQTGGQVHAMVLKHMLESPSSEILKS